MFKKAASCLVALSILVVALNACSPTEPRTSFLVGTISGPETELMQVAQSVAKSQHALDFGIVEFEDYVTPNIALADNTIDANMFQHIPYLEMAKASRGYDFAIVGRTFIYPMGIYSSKLDDISELKQGARVGIPNDPSNEARALLLLDQAGLINVPKGRFNITPRDILDNPHQLTFQELDAAQLPRALPDLDIAAINTNFLIPAGLDLDDALVKESHASPYANIIVTKTQDAEDSRVQSLVKAFQSPEVAQAAERLFEGQAIPAWNASS